VVAVAACAGAALLGGCADHRPPSSQPYVQDVTSDHARIALQTRNVEQLSVVLARGDAAFGEPVQEAAAPASGAHEVRFVGLEPDTEYRWRASGRGGRLMGEGKLRTSPLPETRPLRFAAVGDSGKGDLWKSDDLEAVKHALGNHNRDQGPQGQIAQRMLERDPDLVLHVGDIAYLDGAPERWQSSFFDPFAALIARAPMYACPGDHDLAADGGLTFFQVFHLPASQEGGERFYSFDAGDVHFTCLDTEVTGLYEGGAQLAWLEDDLARARTAWKVVWFHTPLLSKRTHEGQREVLAPRLSSAGVDLVLNGNDHRYERYAPHGGVLYVTTGGGGGDLHESGGQQFPVDKVVAAHHFVLCTADATSLRVEAVDLKGGVFDTVVLKKER